MLAPDTHDLGTGLRFFQHLDYLFLSEPSELVVKPALYTFFLSTGCKLPYFLRPVGICRMPGFNPANVLNGRTICRTILDALDYLGLPDEGGIAATIYAGEIFCPNGDTPRLVLIGTGLTGDCDRRYLRMPDSNTFRGRFADGTPIQGAIDELDRATVKSDGVVVLPDGRQIRSMEFQPAFDSRITTSHLDRNFWFILRSTC